MQELTLQQFFEGQRNIQTLRQELAAAVESRGPNWTSQQIIPMGTDFTVTPQHLVLVCDAVLDDSLPPSLLEAVGFCLTASDRFYWDTDTPAGTLVANTVFDWAAPEVNYPLTKENVQKFKARLLSGSSTLH